MLDIVHYNKAIGATTIFHDLNLCFARGSFTVLLGPSGCGKSTFFDLLTGLQNADSGHIAYEGKKVDNLLRHAAYMQQKDLLLPWATVFENALLPAQVRGDLSDAIHAKCKAYLADFGLAEHHQHLPRELSGGMRQRVALARTLMFERDIILLDEPFSALDALTRRSMQGLLLSLQADFGKTIIMITHDIDEALAIADTILLFTPLPMTLVQEIKLTSTKPRPFDLPEVVAHKKAILEQLQGAA